MEPNVLLVVLDSVRASNLSLHGYVSQTTPFFSTVAEDLTVYTNARSPSIGSRPSHASLFTGHHAAETGISGDRKLKPGTTIWEELQHDGYDTAVFSDNPFLRSNRYGFIQGFETVKTRPEDYVDVPFAAGLDPREINDATDAVSGLRNALSHEAPVRSLLNGASILLSRKYPDIERRLGLAHDTSAATYLDAFEKWLHGREGPWAACLNLMDAHYPYEPESEFDRWGSPVLRELQDDWGRSRYAKSEFRDGDRPWWQLAAFEALYDGTIRQLDAAVERLVEMLDAAGDRDETLLVITSDHGEGFGEQSYFDPDHRLVAHGADGGIHDARSHVPLLVDFPWQSGGRRIDTPASLTEFPAVVRAARNGAAAHDAFVPDRPVLVTLDAGYNRRTCAVYEAATEGVRMEVVNGTDGVTVRIRDSQTKYVESGQAPEARDFLGSFTDAGISTSQQSTDLDQETRNHLKDLGYVS